MSRELMLRIWQVLDPQSALLTTSEVHQFLASNPPRETTRKIGSYKPVNLKNYQSVREDFQRYVTTTVPYIENFPPPELFVKTVVSKLRAFGLTKTEVFMLINLGIGLPRNQSSQPSAAAEDGEEENEAEEVQEPDDRQLLSIVIEELEDRFPGEEGEAKIEKILQTMRTEFNRAQAATKANEANGNGSEAK
ncbi:hypothetical protein A1O1_04673 [Capronia coronata CBS 617.96]|uniref:DNA-directed RNA polymerase III subunit RPC9 n=1 Tax=Capronia coronata CBS 617.96 TaxID=1182541 RepID=W9Y4J3_9EURO|nr:uncharacterized protein A1O1_04673 [Capronia coronata CBS 617.96]EXJ87747.1 hypothetical protein A1O1_04673 [Capronia coronata CBS 617.96]